MADVSLSFAGHALRPLPCGALFWPAESLLLVADLHLEKGSSLARRGSLLPPHDSLDTLDRLAAALERTGARRVAALGDSFHDRDGPARLLPAARARLEAMIATVEWVWISGNHDGASAATLGGQVEPEMLVSGVALRHEALPGEAGPEISGHFHPKVVLQLRAGVRRSRRCFALAGDRLVLPAYGAYAGGLALDDPAWPAALGRWPEALVVLDGGLVRVPPAAREGLAA
jgi:DNA ligase-associated metallophosphoesterase